MKSLFIIYFMCFFTNASTCFTSQEQFALWDKKYGSLFKVDTTLNNSAYDVVATLPKKIDDQNFNSVLLFMGNLEEPSFGASLTTYEDEGETKVWYVSEHNTEKQHFLIFSYGDGCGMSVTVPVVFN